MKNKRIISTILIIMLISLLLPNNALSATLTLDEIREKYKTGELFTESFDGGIQCTAFARKVFYEYYGIMPSKIEKQYDLNKIKPGDILRYRSKNTDETGHEVWVINADYEKLTLAESNYGVPYTIKWDRKLFRTDIIELQYIIPAPYQIPIEDPVILEGEKPDLGETFVAQIIPKYNDAFALVSTAATEGSSIYLKEKSASTKNQQWKFTRQEDGTYTIVNLFTNLAIDINGTGNKDGESVQSGILTGSDKQSWNIYLYNEGYRLVPRSSIKSFRALNIPEELYEQCTEMQILETTTNYINSQTFNIVKYVDNISFTQENYEVNKGDTILSKDIITISPSDASNQKVKLISSEPSIVQVNEEGNLVALNAGKVTITATSTDGLNVSTTCTINVNIKVQAIESTDVNIDLFKTRSYKLNYKVLPEDALNKQVEFISNDDKIVKVDSEGNITGISNGTTQVTVKSKENQDIFYTWTIVVDDLTSDGFKYEVLEDETIRILKYIEYNKEVIIPSSIDGKIVTTIKGDVFSQCEDITKIQIPKEIINIEGNITKNCSKLTSFEVNSENPKYIAENGILYEKKSELPYKLLIYPQGKQETMYIVPESVIKFSEWSIYNNQYLQLIFMKENVQELESYSLCNITNLTNLSILGENTQLLEKAILEIPNLTIYGQENSSAQQYALDNGINFELINIKVRDIDLLETSFSFDNVTTNRKIESIIKPSFATNTKLEYKSEDENIAKVNQEGVVSPVNSGDTVIIVKTTDGSNIQAKVDIHIDVKCSSISVKQNEINIKDNNSKKIEAEAMPDTAKNKVLQYSIKDTTIATIDNQGIITPIKNGTTRIIIQTTDGTNLRKEIPLNVSGISDKEPKPDVDIMPFTDVDKKEWYYDAVEYNYKNKLIKGTSDTTFHPNLNLNRGMMVTILWRMEGAPEVTGKINFTDVSSKDYYYNAIIWATKNKIVSGYTGTTKFGPEDNITREQLAVMLRNYAKYKGKDIMVFTNLTGFKDWKEIDEYANTAMQWAIGKGVITGDSGNKLLKPKNTATRAEAASMIFKYCVKLKV